MPTGAPLITEHLKTSLLHYIDCSESELNAMLSSPTREQFPSVKDGIQYHNIKFHRIGHEIDQEFIILRFEVTPDEREFRILIESQCDSTGTNCKINRFKLKEKGIGFEPLERAS